jgi:hypothetical protein
MKIEAGEIRFLAFFTPKLAIILAQGNGVEDFNSVTLPPCTYL